MDLSFYTAAVGAQMQQERLNVHSDNIANVNNYGFRARIPAFSALMTGQVRGIDRDLPRGVGSKMEDSELDLRPAGVMEETGRALDFAIEGNGFFALLDPRTGQISYTRDGSFIMSELEVDGEPDAQGVVQKKVVWRLTDGNGRYVLDAAEKPIDLPGGIATSPVDSRELLTEEYPIGIFDFLNHNGMQSMSENRLVPVNKNGTRALGSGQLIQGFLELSNTNLAQEITKVIESQRSFQYMLRMVTTSDEIENTVNNLR